MSAIFRYFSLRHLRTHLPRVLLGLSAVALGVALFVSTSVTTTSVRASMREAMQDLAGQAQWQVLRGRSLGVEEALLARIRAIPHAVAAPIIQSSAVLIEPRGGTLLVLGIDFWNDSLLRLYKFQGNVDLGAFVTTAFVPDGIIVTHRFAERYGLHVGSRVRLNTTLGTQDLRITGLIEDQGPARVLDGNFAIMELHAAQSLFGRPGFVDRIEVAHTTRGQLEHTCPGYEVAPTLRGSSILEDALARMDALAAVSVIAMLVGLFIIYNSVQISVVERLKEIGTLRALGATRRQILLVLLLEWLVVGLAGALLGIGAGYALAKSLLISTSRTLNALVPLITVQNVKITPLIILAAVVLGVGATLAATAIPALGVIRVYPLDLLRPYSMRTVSHHRLAFRIGAALFCLGAGMVGLIRVSPVASLAAIGLVFLGLPLMLPRIVILFAYRTRPVLQRLLRLEGYLAADNMIKFPQRTALTAATLGGALAMMVATATLVEGFRTASSEWITQAFPFDFAVMATDFKSSLYSGQVVPRTLVDTVRHVNGVEMAYGVRLVFVDYRGASIMVLGIETRSFLAMHRRRGLTAWSRQLTNPEDIRRLIAGEGVYVSENFAALFGVRPGERITLPTPSGPRAFVVLREIEDYSWPHGLVVLDLDVLERLWKEDRVTYIDLYVSPGASKESVRAHLADALKGRYSLFIYDKEQIRQISEDVLRQTVVVANIQVIIAIVIGFLGIVNSLLISVLQRKREIGLLRAVGMTRRQVARTVVIEGVLIAAVAGVIGVIGGLVGGWLPLRLFLFTITGYLYPLVVPWEHLLLSLAAAVIIGISASLIPARQAANLPILDAIGYE